MGSLKRWMSGVVVLLVAGSSPVARAQSSASPLADDPTLIALAVALSCADAPEAVEAAPQGSSGPAATGPEIELVATVRAKTLKFDEVPKVDVVFSGSGKRRTVWKTERVNLPVHPQPGVVYRDVQVRLTITSDLEELTSMLRGAKRASRGIRIEEVASAAPAAAKPAAAASGAKPAPTATTTATATPTTKTSATATATSTATPTSTSTPTPTATATPTPTPTPTATPTSSTTAPPAAKPPAAATPSTAAASAAPSKPPAPSAPATH